jgi:hypothetical protein
MIAADRRRVRQSVRLLVLGVFALAIQTGMELEGAPAIVVATLGGVLLGGAWSMIGNIGKEVKK